MKMTQAICALMLGMAATGCSTFNREWKMAATEPRPVNDITGPWEGSWNSDKNGHSGNLRCLLSKIDDTHYRARYKATYRKIMRFGYTLAMNVKHGTDNAYNFQGEADLGWWAGGVYHYEGQITSTNFVSTYKSKYDQGTFRMKRPE